MRRYWQPVALAEEPPEGGAPLPVDILSEELGVSDMAIIAARKMMPRGMEAIEQGEDPPNILRDPAKRTSPNLVVFNQAIDDHVDVKTHCRKLTETARAKVPAE